MHDNIFIIQVEIKLLNVIYFYLTLYDLIFRVKAICNILSITMPHHINPTYIRIIRFLLQFKLSLFWKYYYILTLAIFSECNVLCFSWMLSFYTRLDISLQCAWCLEAMSLWRYTTRSFSNTLKDSAAVTLLTVLQIHI